MEKSKEEPAKIIGKISKRDLKQRVTRSSRGVISGGTLIGSVVLRGIKGIPGVSFARCNLRRNHRGLFAVRNGVFIRPVSTSILKDSSFQRA